LFDTKRQEKLKPIIIGVWAPLFFARECPEIFQTMAFFLENGISQKKVFTM